ncbi:hypothetical protein LEN26_014258 [Aphanomyces euteiches]|nr:hypothetical protein LEN26_014258 [Aphanomyces euteiches]KAH9129829.1 hypothetical protein AeMF1_000177 [Aphanomyces euteiches]KAH9195735.1 hypothetical protein AeNC1_002276 [Aphanomyces euteiches]
MTDEAKIQWTSDDNDGLPMLFAVDDQLHDELTYVYNLLAEPVEQPKAPNPNTSRARQLREMDKLRQEIADLKVQLRQAKRQYVASMVPMSVWEGAARQQRIEKERAIQENEKLRSQVHEYATFIDLLEASMHKKPRLSLDADLASPTWQEYKLAAHAALRVAAIHAIADREYRRLHYNMTSAGLHDYTGQDFLRVHPLIRDDGKVVIEAVYHLTVPAPFHPVGKALWDVVNGTHGPDLPGEERMDDFTVYRTLRLANTTGEVHSNFVRKYFPEDDRDIVLWRSVLNDELIPQMDQGAVNDESGWVVVRAKDAHTCYIQTVLHMVDSQGTCDRLGAAEILIDCWSSLDTNTLLPRGQEPQPMQTFMAIGRRIELAAKRAIDAVVSKYHP